MLPLQRADQNTITPKSLGITGVDARVCVVLWGPKVLRTAAILGRGKLQGRNIRNQTNFNSSSSTTQNNLQDECTKFSNQVQTYNTHLANMEHSNSQTTVNLAAKRYQDCILDQDLAEHLQPFETGVKPRQDMTARGDELTTERRDTVQNDLKRATCKPYW